LGWVTFGSSRLILVGLGNLRFLQVKLNYEQVGELGLVTVTLTSTRIYDLHYSTYTRVPGSVSIHILRTVVLDYGELLAYWFILQSGESKSHLICQLFRPFSIGPGQCRAGNPGTDGGCGDGGLRRRQSSSTEAVVGLRDDDTMASAMMASSADGGDGDGGRRPQLCSGG
jgi:hypothetical protein